MTAVVVLRIEVNAPESSVQGIKECLAMELERFGDVRVVSVDAVKEPGRDRQISMWAAREGYRQAAKLA